MVLNLYCIEMHVSCPESQIASVYMVKQEKWTSLDYEEFLISTRTGSLSP